MSAEESATESRGERSSHCRSMLSAVWSNHPLWSVHSNIELLRPRVRPICTVVLPCVCTLSFRCRKTGHVTLPEGVVFVPTHYSAQASGISWPWFPFKPRRYLVVVLTLLGESEEKSSEVPMLLQQLHISEEHHAWLKNQNFQTKDDLAMGVCERDYDKAEKLAMEIGLQDLLLKDLPTVGPLVIAFLEFGSDRFPE